MLKLLGIELRGYPVVWDGRDEQGNPVPLGDYQLLFYTANHAGLFGSYTAAFRVVPAYAGIVLPAGGVVPTSAPLAPIDPPDDAPWRLLSFVSSTTGITGGIVMYCGQQPQKGITQETEIASYIA